MSCKALDYLTQRRAASIQFTATVEGASDNQIAVVQAQANNMNPANLTAAVHTATATLGTSIEVAPIQDIEETVVTTTVQEMACQAGSTGPLCGICDTDAGYVLKAVLRTGAAVAVSDPEHPLCLMPHF